MCVVSVEYDLRVVLCKGRLYKYTVLMNTVVFHTLIVPINTPMCYIYEYWSYHIHQDLHILDA